MNHAALKILIDTEPANAPPATDQDVLDWLKQSVTVQTDIAWTEYMLWLSSTSGLRKLTAAEADVTHRDAIRNAAGLAIIVAQAGQQLSLSRDDVRAALAPLIGPVFTVAEKDALLALSDTSAQRWRAAGFPVLDDPSWLYHIAQARAL